MELHFHYSTIPLFHYSTIPLFHYSVVFSTGMLSHNYLSWDCGRMDVKFARFLTEAEYSKDKFYEIIGRFNLLEAYKKIKGEENE